MSNVGAEIDDFIELLSAGKDMEIPGAEGAATVAVCEAIIASAASGQPEKIEYIK